MTKLEEQKLFLFGYNSEPRRSEGERDGEGEQRNQASYFIKFILFFSSLSLFLLVSSPVVLSPRRPLPPLFFSPQSSYSTVFSSPLSLSHVVHSPYVISPYVFSLPILFPCVMFTHLFFPVVLFVSPSPVSFSPMSSSPCLCPLIFFSRVLFLCLLPRCPLPSSSSYPVSSSLCLLSSRVTRDHFLYVFLPETETGRNLRKIYDHA